MIGPYASNSAHYIGYTVNNKIMVKVGPWLWLASASVLFTLDHDNVCVFNDNVLQYFQSFKIDIYYHSDSEAPYPIGYSARLVTRRVQVRSYTLVITL